MRTLIITAFMSLDGVMEAPGGEEGYRNAGWTFRDIPFDEAAYEIKGREQDEATALLLGRRSYQAFSPVWPSMTEDFARYNELPKYVVSSTLTDADLVDDWGPTSILRSVEEVAGLKESDGGPIIVHGSATLGHALSEAGLVDRYHLLVFPLLLGAGKRLFGTADVDAIPLALTEHEAYGNGVQKMVFDVVRKAGD
ncbi:MULTISPECIES: dihydrofolate reductase family protein [unclassified Dietzia]|uniref:dihydrofolate reductase family protein n=1 Tax=unclassified Dietzia TaxID=2617939 RepID=UPI000D2216C3|nr:MULTISPECIES: dihydrofolate reductase family protein [unclassified Dietzia]AVZ40479.1 deaminase [Dietzia sp. JS16-p6b]MBB1025139.1 dihydrofolate reductase family protein [Dietzia sp. DQ12-76]MBB1028295.1 dihydrofolate reductase family protein [Dietzia sp. DQ11-38-2]QGW26000.1 Bifunctional deaminase-reductase domain protein [Dietzia sp. DQ12-45-1b]